MVWESGYKLRLILSLSYLWGHHAYGVQAAERLRKLVSRIELVPDGEELAIVLRGDPDVCGW